MRGQKYIVVLVMLAVIASLAAGTAWAQGRGRPAEANNVYYVGRNVGILSNGVLTTPLYAGAGQNDITKGTLIGEVSVWNDADYLYVKYLITETGWTISLAHLYVGTVPPPTHAPGLFPYQAALNDVTEHTFMIPLTWDPGTTLYIAAHAEACWEAPPVLLTKRDIKVNLTKVGEVCVYCDGENIIVKLKAQERGSLLPWEFVNTYVFIGLAPPPNADPNTFPYKHVGLGGPTYGTGVSTDEYIIPLADLGLDPCEDAGVTICMSIAATVRANAFNTYTGWAVGTAFGCPPCARYFCFELRCPKVKCETAWAYGPFPFSELARPWGWYFDYEVQEANNGG